MQADINICAKMRSDIGFMNFRGGKHFSLEISTCSYWQALYLFPSISESFSKCNTSKALMTTYPWLKPWQLKFKFTQISQLTLAIIVSGAKHFSIGLEEHNHSHQIQNHFTYKTGKALTMTYPLCNLWQFELALRPIWDLTLTMQASGAKNFFHRIRRI